MSVRLVKITYLNNGFVQIKKMINYCRAEVDRKEEFFTMNSPIYEAIADGTYCIDLGYGKHPFTVEDVLPDKTT
jgi:hypothetical protein